MINPLKCCLTFIVTLFSPLIYLSLSDPQDHRLAYMFHAYVLPSYDNGKFIAATGEIPFPNEYTGRYVTWKKNGELQKVQYLVEGMIFGPAYSTQNKKVVLEYGKPRKLKNQ